jgi:D-amino-acid dehydrogenase
VDDPGGYDFACAAAQAYPALVAELADLGEADVSYRQSGAIVVADREDELEPVRAALEARRAGHPEMGDVQVVTGSAVQRLFPPLRPHMPAVHIPGAARIDGRKFMHALVRAACRKGATIRAGDAALVCQAGRVTGVLADRELIEADAVVAATGAWTTSFLEPAGVVVRVSPQRGQIVHLSLGSTDTRHWPVVLPVVSGHYLLAFEDSRVVVGATREPGAGFDHRVTAAGLCRRYWRRP